MKHFTNIAMVALAIALPTAQAHAQTPPDVRCEIQKLKTVASYSACRLKADATALARNATADFSNCVSKITTKFPKFEDDAGPGVCPSENDVADIKGRTDDFESAISTLLSGGTLPTAACGDGTVDVGEDCDVGNLNGQTCASQGFFNGILACGPGCTFDTSGCNATRFEDTGNTILDHQYALEWEKKGNSDGTANLADAHDVDNTYSWAVSGSSTTQSGTLYSDFLAKLNGITNSSTITTSGCYENHCDWRVPTIDEVKTITILAPGCGSAPCVQDSLFLPNRSGRYWSNSSRDGIPTGAYFMEFLTGTAAGNIKTTLYFARAVRSTS